MYVKGVTAPKVGPLASGTSVNALSSSQRSASFGEVMKRVSAEIENLDREYLNSQMDLILGNARDMHTAVLNAEKASLALDLVIAVRNKAIEAYQEIMRMPV